MNLQQEGQISFETEGAFYNPKMKLNRDIGVAVAKALSLNDYLDALSASGIRGMRVAKEASVEKVTLNDISPVAYELIQRNLARNQIDCQATSCNANTLMHEKHFQAVDLDPFGSPSPYLTAASRCAVKYLFITATDTAPLCGAHLKSGIRKYMARPLCTDYHREMGARVLLGLAARELARWDKGFSPMLTHATDHYVRTYLRIVKGAKAADDCLEDLGYIEHCPVCSSFALLHEPRPEGSCHHCGGKTQLSGPMWLGRTYEKEIVSCAIDCLQGGGRALRLLETCAQEEDIPFYYDHHTICERLKITPAKIDHIVDTLRYAGHRASRTHFCRLGVKTNALLREVEEAAKSA
jgi:tRNA (guanine26-N2/guanine27-N2)-dimethyltransferase